MEIKVHVDFEDTKIAFSSKSTKQLKRAYFLFAIVNRKWLTELSTWLVNIAFSTGIPINWIIKKTVFQHFCGGESIADSAKTIQELKVHNIKSILDYSEEGADTEQSFDKSVVETLNTMSMAKNSDWMPFCVFKATGFGRAALLEKIHRKETLTAQEEEEFGNFLKRVESICQFGFENDVPILIDAEETWLQDPIDKIAYEMMEKYNRAKAIVYNTYQMYRVDGLAELKAAFQRATAGNYYLGAKLVRGAYMEKERARAGEIGYKDPIHVDKRGTDEAINQGLKFCVNNKQRIFLFCGSHNEYSNYYLTILIDKHGLENNDPRIYFGQLYGMSDHITYNLAAKGYNVVKYVPYGSIRQVMPYLFRRAEENTSARGQSSRELKLLKMELRRRKNSR